MKKRLLIIINDKIKLKSCTQEMKEFILNPEIQYFKLSINEKLNIIKSLEKDYNKPDKNSLMSEYYLSFYYSGNLNYNFYKKPTANILYNINNCFLNRKETILEIEKSCWSYSINKNKLIEQTTLNKILYKYSPQSLLTPDNIKLCDSLSGLLILFNHEMLIKTLNNINQIKIFYI